MSDTLHVDDAGYVDLVRQYHLQGNPQVVLDATGLAWLVYKAADVLFFVSVDRDDPAWFVKNTNGRWHKIYGYIPQEEN